MRLAPLLLLGGMLAACASTGPHSVTGTLPASGSYAIIAADTLSPAAQATLSRALNAHGMVASPEGQRPDRLLLLTLADRPLINGSFAGDKSPADRKASGWIDRPQKGTFGRNRREIRLTISFLSRDGDVREERTATQIVPRKAPLPDLSKLIDSALAH